jgi:sortase B
MPGDKYNNDCDGKIDISGIDEKSTDMTGLQKAMSEDAIQDQIMDGQTDEVCVAEAEASDKVKANESEISEDLKKEEKQTEKELIRKKKLFRYKLIQIIFSVSLVVFSVLFINEILIQPYRTKKAIERIHQLYQNSEEKTVTEPILQEPSVTALPDKENEDSDTIIVKDPKRDEQGRLLQFQDLLSVNKDVKGWISVPDTNIDYVVVQSSNEDPEYYLRRNIFKKDDKAGTLFIDYKSSIEDKTQNLVIHGHNMYSTDNMFHYLTEYKNLDFYKERPVFTFDTIYQTGKWKIFAVFITNGSSEKEELFDYTRTDFTSSSDFLNFVYRLRIRSLYLMDTVDINENDQLLTLSTCSYEVKNYRTVVVARKLRGGEDEAVDVESVTINPQPLYPWSYYYRYGGKEPELTQTFEAALEAGEVNWYKPTDEPIKREY